MCCYIWLRLVVSGCVWLRPCARICGCRSLRAGAGPDAERDENLVSNQLSASDRARFTKRRKDAYEALHPETRAGHAGAHARHAMDNLSTASYAADQAAATSVDERTVRRDAERGEKVCGKALDLVHGTKLDTGVYLDKLKVLSDDDQVAKVKSDLAALRVVAKPSPDTVKRNKVDADVKARAAKEVAEIIAEHVPGEWWDAVKSNLYAAGAANIAHELTNITGQSIMDRSAA